ncbi:tetratricopeptide repeat protein [Vibrio panuliri]|uniref:MSHA biogenesis protein MshN n=1 Tax=Vibrio panuliri TaxID=1381081 RepID=A0ABX3FML1_9VIBR|nr:tetratricopeptide repeat protein [Vibrio panuliri]KAB1455420.1 tetratricopeptide repeat protein [Vibrio panuliri]OLQ95456.1 MSHA biogenesis protein MshN [Vibrio panuliri]
MSAINNALSELSKSQTVTKAQIEKAQVQVVKKTNALPWVIGGFSLSLAVGGWAISQQSMPPSQITSEVTQQPVRAAASSISSPTVKPSQSSEVIYSAPRKVQAVAKQNIAKETSSVPQVSTVEKPLAQVEETDLTTQSSIHLAQVALSRDESVQDNQATQADAAVSSGEVVVEQVELTPTQLAAKAQSRAKKALDANDLASAISHFNDALRYTPRDSEVRQTLAALFYGKGEVRKSVDLLQQGIALAQDDQSLRIAMAKLLIKEQQTSAALTPLVYLPSHPNSEYLSLRAALAQKSGQDDVALESYQLLVQLEPQNGRWWLGLGIQQERAFELDKAQKSYQQALNKVGLSSQSQQFIRDRLALLGRLQEQPNEN